MPEHKIEHADARDGADNPANGVSDVVVGAGRMVDAVAAGARDPPLQADDLGDKQIMARRLPVGVPDDVPPCA